MKGVVTWGNLTRIQEVGQDAPQVEVKVMIEVISESVVS